MKFLETHFEGSRREVADNVPSNAAEGFSKPGDAAASRLELSAGLDNASTAAILAHVCVLLRVARQDRGWRLSEFAATWGISQSVLCRLELTRREPSLRQMVEVYGLLGLRLSEVLRIAEDQAFPLGGAPWDGRTWPGEPKAM